MPAKIVKMPKPASKPASSSQLPEVIPQQLLQQLLESLSGGEVVLPSDVRSLQFSLQKLMASEGPEDELGEARAQALELAFDATEASSKTEARKLAHKALRLDADCVDALVLLADLEAHSPQEKIALLQKAVAAGERTLGEEFIQENRGHFWLHLDTRPYMRALAQLAYLFTAEQQMPEAIVVYEKMLELNPNDNQGVREPLLGAYLWSGDLSKAAELLQKYKDDASAAFAWGRVLERFLAQDLTKAKALLPKARKANPFVETFLVDNHPLPLGAQEINSYTLGSVEEAVLCMESIGRAWQRSAEALAWLSQGSGTKSFGPRTRKAPAAKPRRKAAPKASGKP
jgi:tetratricopeptide (TPR) repeat protein